MLEQIHLLVGTRNCLQQEQGWGLLVVQSAEDQWQAELEPNHAAMVHRDWYSYYCDDVHLQGRVAVSLWRTLV